VTLRGRAALAEPAAVAAIIAAQVYLLTRSVHTRTVFDEGVYLLSIDALGHGEALGREVFTSQGPLYYVLLRGIGLVFGVSVTGVRLGMVAIAAAGTLLAYLLGRRVAGSLGGVACATALAIGPKLSYLGAAIYADMPAMVIVVAALTLAARGRFAPAGAALGAATLVKVSALAAAPTLLVLAALAEPRFRRLAFTAAGFVAAVAVVALVFVRDLGDIWTGAVTYHLRGRHQVGLSAGKEIEHFFSVQTPFLWLVVAGLLASALVWRRVWPYWLWAAATLVFELTYTPLRENQLVSLPFAFGIPAGLALGLAAARLPLRLVAPAVAVGAAAAAAGWVQQLHYVTRDVVQPESPELIRAAAELRRVTRPGDLVISDQPIVAFLAGRQTPGAYVDTASLRFDTRTLTDAQVARDAKRVAAVVVGRAFLTHDELLALFRRWFRHRIALPGATIYYDPQLRSTR
jgi:hypothetical protein